MKNPAMGLLVPYPLAGRGRGGVLMQTEMCELQSSLPMQAPHPCPSLKGGDKKECLLPPSKIRANAANFPIAVARGFRFLAAANFFWQGRWSVCRLCWSWRFNRGGVCHHDTLRAALTCVQKASSTSSIWRMNGSSRATCMRMGGLSGR